MTRKTLPIIAVVIFGVLSAGTLVMASGWSVSDETAPGRIVEAVREQVELLKWVGGSMVSGLVAAIVWLVSSLKTAQNEVREITRASTTADERLADAIESLKTELCRRPCMKDQ